jgi:hypothetical protein
MPETFMGDKLMMKYAGMTVNERLVEAGLLDDFDSAVRHENKDKMVALLVRVDIELHDAIRTAEEIISHPTRYGRL